MSEIIFPKKTDEEFEGLFMSIINPSQSSKDSSYKFAFARFLVDYSVESSQNNVSFSTIAEYFLRYYWSQECNSKIKQTSYKEMKIEGKSKVKQFLVSKIITKSENFGNTVYPESYDKIKNQSKFMREIKNCVSEIEKNCFNDVTYSFQFVKRGRETENISPVFFDYTIRGYKKRSERKTDLPLIDLKKGIILNPNAMKFFKRYHVVLQKAIILEWTRFVEQFNEGVPSLIEKIEGKQDERKNTAKERTILYKLFKNCFYCNDILNAKPVPSNHELYKKNQEVEHVIPFAYGRSHADEMWNFVLSCKECNCNKLASLPPEKYLKNLYERNSEYKDKIPELKRSLDKLGVDPQRIIQNYYNGALDSGFSVFDNFKKSIC